MSIAYQYIVFTFDLEYDWKYFENIKKISRLLLLIL